MITLKCGEASKFEFQMQIFGDAAGAAEVCFHIQCPTMGLSFPATMLEGGSYSVSVPDLERFLEPGTYECGMWVFIGDNVFKPVKEQCTLVPRVNAAISNFRQTATPPPAPQPVIKPMINPVPKPEPMTVIQPSPLQQAPDLSMTLDTSSEEMVEKPHPNIPPAPEKVPEKIRMVKKPEPVKAEPKPDDDLLSKLLKRTPQPPA